MEDTETLNSLIKILYIWETSMIYSSNFIEKLRNIVIERVIIISNQNQKHASITLPTQKLTPIKSKEPTFLLNDLILVKENPISKSLLEIKKLESSCAKNNSEFSKTMENIELNSLAINLPEGEFERAKLKGTSNSLRKEQLKTALSLIEEQKKLNLETLFSYEEAYNTIQKDLKINYEEFNKFNYSVLHFFYSESGRVQGFL